MRLTERNAYHLGYWVNQYAGWHKIESFREPVDLVRYLKVHGSKIESIDFVSFKVL